MAAVGHVQSLREPKEQLGTTQGEPCPLPSSLWGSLNSRAGAGTSAFSHQRINLSFASGPNSSHSIDLKDVGLEDPC